MLTVLNIDLRKLIETKTHYSLKNIVFNIKLSTILQNYVQSYVSSRSKVCTFTSAQIDHMKQISHQKAPVYRCMKDDVLDNYANINLSPGRIYYSSSLDVVVMPESIKKQDALLFIKLCDVVSKMEYSLDVLKDEAFPAWVRAFNNALGLPPADVTFNSPVFLPIAPSSKGYFKDGIFHYKVEKDRELYTTPTKQTIPYAIYSMRWSYDKNGVSKLKSWSAIAPSSLDEGIYDLSSDIIGRRNADAIRSLMQNISPRERVDEGNDMHRQPCYLNVSFSRIPETWELNTYLKVKIDPKLVTIVGKKGSGKSTITNSLSDISESVDSDEWGRCVNAYRLLNDIDYANTSNIFNISDEDYLLLKSNPGMKENELFNFLVDNGIQSNTSVFKNESLRHVISKVKKNDYVSSPDSLLPKSSFGKFYIMILNDKISGFRNYIMRRIDNIRTTKPEIPIIVFTHTTSESSLVLGATDQIEIIPTINPIVSIYLRKPQDGVDAEYDTPSELFLYHYYSKNISSQRKLSIMQIIQAYTHKDSNLIIKKVEIPNTLSDRLIELKSTLVTTLNNNFESMSIRDISNILTDSKELRGGNYNISAYITELTSIVSAISKYSTLNLTQKVLDNIHQYNKYLHTINGMSDFFDYTSESNISNYVKSVRPFGIITNVDIQQGYLYTDLDEDMILTYLLFQGCKYVETNKTSKNTRHNTIIKEFYCILNINMLVEFGLKYRCHLYADIPLKKLTMLINGIRQLNFEKLSTPNDDIIQNPTALYLRQNCITVIDNETGYKMKGIKTSSNSIAFNNHVYEDMKHQHHSSQYDWIILFDGIKNGFLSMGPIKKTKLGFNDVIEITFRKSFKFNSFGNMPKSPVSFMLDQNEFKNTEIQNDGIPIETNINTIHINKEITCNKSKWIPFKERGLNCGTLIYNHKDHTCGLLSFGNDESVGYEVSSRGRRCFNK